MHTVLGPQVRLFGGRILLNNDTAQKILRDQDLVMRDLGQRSGIRQCFIRFENMTRFCLVGPVVQLAGFFFCGSYDGLRFSELSSLRTESFSGTAQFTMGGRDEPASDPNDRKAHRDHNSEQQRPVFLPSVNGHLVVTAWPPYDELPDTICQSSLVPGGHGSSNGNGRRSLL